MERSSTSQSPSSTASYSLGARTKGPLVIAKWAAAGFMDTLLRWKMKPAAAQSANLFTQRCEHHRRLERRPARAAGAPHPFLPHR
jgi:hypothetical protein